jgi:TPR repeat protein
MKLSAEPAEPAGRFARQDEVEADYRRMCQLRRMSFVELRVLLAGEPCKAAPWVETAARYGLVEAQLRLGQMRLDGLGAPKDEGAAFTWFMRAAKRNSPEAMNMVGRCYENGWGRTVDLSAAADWYRRSAEAGHDWGEYNYANMLFDGRGVARDQAQAVAGYRRAADKGHARAMNLLARCCEEGWGTPRDIAAACDGYRRSAQGGYFRGQFNYGALLAAHGRIDEALGWFDKACQGAPPDSLRAMVQVLLRQNHPRLAEFARATAARLPDNNSERRGEAQS